MYARDVRGKQFYHYPVRILTFFELTLKKLKLIVNCNWTLLHVVVHNVCYSLASLCINKKNCIYLFKQFAVCASVSHLISLVAKYNTEHEITVNNNCNNCQMISFTSCADWIVTASRGELLLISYPIVSSVVQI